MVLRKWVRSLGFIRTCILGVALDEGTVRLDLVVDKLMLIHVLANSVNSRLPYHGIKNPAPPQSASRCHQR